MDFGKWLRWIYQTTDGMRTEFGILLVNVGLAALLWYWWPLALGLLVGCGVGVYSFEKTLLPVVSVSRVVVFVCVIVSVSALSLVALSPLVLFRRASVPAFAHACGGVIMRSGLRVLNVAVRVDGREHVPATGTAVVYVVNHQTVLDIPVFYALGVPFVWVSKQSVFYAPCGGAVMFLAGYIGLVEHSRDSVVDMLSKCRVALQHGQSVVFFPEGARNRRRLPFRLGAFALAADVGIPVVPITLVMPESIWTWSCSRTECRIVVHPAIQPGPPAYEVMQNAHDMIRSVL